MLTNASFDPLFDSIHGERSQQTNIPWHKKGALATGNFAHTAFINFTLASFSGRTFMPICFPFFRCGGNEKSLTIIFHL